ncbi:hypothetical protein HDU98_001211 [Podochytrium sp. JEL0797]|nr:hypothetical protein HDU98_001211 [Podochytrium sp. JEL0797]
MGWLAILVHAAIVFTSFTGSAFGQTNCLFMNQAWPLVFTSSEPATCCNVTAAEFEFVAGNRQQQRNGVVCNDHGDIISIVFVNASLAGPVKLLPLGLTHLELQYNSFTGPLPPLPAGLTYLDIGFNSFSGPIPNPLPSNMTDL